MVVTSIITDVSCMLHKHVAPRKSIAPTLIACSFTSLLYLSTFFKNHKTWDVMVNCPLCQWMVGTWGLPWCWEWRESCTFRDTSSVVYLWIRWCFGLSTLDTLIKGGQLQGDQTWACVPCPIMRIAWLFKWRSPRDYARQGASSSLSQA